MRGYSPLMTDTRSIARAPWQVVFTACALFVAATPTLYSALVHVISTGDHAGIAANLGEWNNSQGWSDPTTNDVWEWLILSGTVFIALAAITLILGMLVWQGILRPGVRLTATIFTFISALSAVPPLLMSTEGANRQPEGTLLLGGIFMVPALLGCLSLWFGAGKAWVAAKD